MSGVAGSPRHVASPSCATSSNTATITGPLAGPRATVDIEEFRSLPRKLTNEEELMARRPRRNVPKASKPQHKMRKTEDVQVVMPDGGRIALHI